MQRLALTLVLAMSTTAGTTLAGEADKAPAPEDRYLWLEDVSRARRRSRGPRARSAESMAEVGGTPVEADARGAHSSTILDSRERIPYVSKHGPWCYNFWRDETNTRGLWRRTSLEEYKKPQPAWETVLDVDQLAAAEKENWVWKGYQIAVSELRPLPGGAVPRRG